MQTVRNIRTFCISQSLAVVAQSRQLPKGGGGTYRIINGTQSAITEFPYLVSIQRRTSISKDHICGGAFINSDWILTAAHCLADETPETVIIRAETSFHERGGTLLRVGQLIVHEKFNGSASKDYDYGLIKLRKTFRRAVPAKLKNGPRRFRPGERCTVMGWGQTATTSISKRVLKATVPIVAQRICQKAYQDTEDEVTSRMLCAGYPNGGTDACEGDSGGPLVCRRKLTGIISWAEGCAESNYYGVYSYVTPMRAWIRNYTGV
ncbi:trypsin-1-like [Culex pipiens pallens]|uniref:trypsin-1-like n=1 Tax=Culex pipiens pallens TaxID=42434 RepID=UPI0022AA4129|nr:trypsin-1-like [Culex pipiens pallens]